jgi:uncharacterized protein DUF732
MHTECLALSLRSGMDTTQIRTAGAAISAILVAGLIGGIPAATADDPDHAYLSAVAALGVSTANRDALISAGHATCDSSGNPYAQVGLRGQFMNAGVPFGQTGAAQIAAMRQYCPDVLHAHGLS